MAQTVRIIPLFRSSMQQSSDTILQCIKLFGDRNLEATFLLTKSDCNQSDEFNAVRDALKTQDIGLHDLDSCDALRVDPVEWDLGVEKLRTRLEPEYEAVSFYAGRIPSCIATDCWAPQAYTLLSRWGLRSLISRHGWVDNNGMPYYFGGRMHISQLRDAWIDWKIAFSYEQLFQAGVQPAIDRYANTGGVIILYVDVENDVQVDQLGLLVDRLIDMENVVVQSVRQTIDALADISYEHTITMDHMKQIAQHASGELLQPFTYEIGDLCPSEQLYLLCAAWSTSHRKGKPVRNSTRQTPLGPKQVVQTDESVKQIQADELMQTIDQVVDTIHSNNQLPEYVEVRQGKIGIRDFLPTVAGGFDGDLTPRDLPIRKATFPEQDWLVREELPPSLVQAAEVQRWTFKNARLEGALG